MLNILVAGAGKGIGKATADLAHERGHNIIAVSRDKNDLLGRPYKILTLDLLEPESIEPVCSYSSDIEAVINCTGTHPGMKKIGDGWWIGNIFDIVNLNLRPALHLYQAFLNEFRRKNKGHFIHISSSALDFFDESESGYCASKAALEAIVLSLQNGDKGTGILHHAARVSLTDTPLARKVCPGITDWSKFHTAREIASYLIDIAENPVHYPKAIVTPPYKPIRP